MIVTIPSKKEHQGYYSMTVEISDACPICGGQRGKPYEGLSYDGSMRLNVSLWNNACGHVDLYDNVREEYFNSVQDRMASQP